MRVTLHQAQPRFTRRRVRARPARRWLLLLLTGGLLLGWGLHAPLRSVLGRVWLGLLTRAGGGLALAATPAAGPAPLAAPLPPPPPPDPTGADFDRLAAALPALLELYGARSAVWFQDLKTGREIAIGTDQRFHPASTLKLPLVVALIEGAKAGRWSLDDPWPIKTADWEEGAGNLQLVPDGTAFALRELARRAIEDSDNIAANALFRKVGYDGVQDSMRRAGAPLQSGTLSSLSVTDIGPVLVQLARRVAAQPETWRPLMDWLSHTTRNDWLPAGLPPGFTAYHKWGGYDGNDHDVAIVRAANAQYVLVVYTYRTRDDGALIQAVSARVARVYEPTGEPASLR